jgi:hypothetical protein
MPAQAKLEKVVLEGVACRLCFNCISF